MSNGPAKSESEDRIDRLTDLIEAERELRAAVTTFEQAQRSVISAAEQVQTWADQWLCCRNRALQGIPETLTAEAVTWRGTDSALAEANKVMRNFCDDVAEKNRAIAALEPEAPPAPADLYTGEFGDEPGGGGGVDEADKPLEPEQMVVDAAEFGGVQIPEGFTKWEGGECPVADPFAMFVYRLRSGLARESCGGLTLDWAHTGSGNDIIAYRIISQPAESEESGGDLPEGFEAWEGGDWTGDPLDEVKVIFHDEPTPYFTVPAESLEPLWNWSLCRPDDQRIVAFRLVKAYTAPSTDDSAASAEGVRNNGDETGAVASEQSPQSITQDPELIAAVERAEAALDRDRIVTRYADEWAQPNAPDVPEPGYVGLNDPDLDAEFEAMKAREAAEKPKPRFSIFGRVKEDA